MEKMGSYLETFTLKVEDYVQSRMILNLSYLPSSNMIIPFNNAKHRKNNKQLQQVPLLPNLNNINTTTSYSRIEVDCKLLPQESCIRMLNDKTELVNSTQSFKYHFGYDLDHKTIRYNELQELFVAMQFLVHIESTKESTSLQELT